MRIGGLPHSARAVSKLCRITAKWKTPLLHSGSAAVGACRTPVMRSAAAAALGSCGSWTLSHDRDAKNATAAPGSCSNRSMSHDHHAEGACVARSKCSSERMSHRSCGEAPGCTRRRIGVLGEAAVRQSALSGAHFRETGVLQTIFLVKSALSASPAFLPAALLSTPTEK